MRRLLRLIIACFLSAPAAAGCAAWSHTNEPLSPSGGAPPATRATLHPREPRGDPGVLVLLALSGGGSRAAWFSAAVMLELEEILRDDGFNLLHEVDVISAVSGGSFPAAYYCISQDASPMVSIRTAVRSVPATLAEAVDVDASDPSRLTLRPRRPLTADDVTALKAHLAPAGPADVRALERLRALSLKVRSGRPWSREEVEELFARDFRFRWLGNCLWPWNVALRWFTAYDRTDVLAQTLADNLYDRSRSGFDLTFADLSPERPYLIINATEGTSGDRVDWRKGDRSQAYGRRFTFTDEEFAGALASDLSSYSLGRAVAASAAFPAVFNYMTLRNHHDPEREEYVHLFDGGNSDNLGLLSLRDVIRTAEAGAPEERPRRYVVISVDAATQPVGKSAMAPDPRSALWEFLVGLDPNFLDTFDMLLLVNRSNVLASFLSTEETFALARTAPVAEGWPGLAQQRLNEPPTARFTAWQPHHLGARLITWHITFADLGALDGNLHARVNRIPTALSLTDDECDDLRRAAKLLVRSAPEKLRAIRGCFAP